MPAPEAWSGAGPTQGAPKRRNNPAAAAAPGGATQDAAPRNAKRKKVEEPAGSDSDVGGKKGDEGGETATKIDFRDLPDDALYKYLEIHGLVPVFSPCPWNDTSATLPQNLYPSTNPNPTSTLTNPKRPASPIKPTPTPSAAGAGPSIKRAPSDTGGSGAVTPAEGGAEEDDNAPTTRSKTAPQRKEPTPPPTTGSGSSVVILADVQAARDILADKANAHWAKGLGGGQNKESETIVNFLYKMKVGPGRLLRVHNPYPNPYFAS